MPVIRRSNDHRVNVFPLYQFPEILVQFRSFSGHLFHVLCSFIEPVIVHIAQSSTAYARLFHEIHEIGPAHIFTADKAYHKRICRRNGFHGSRKGT